MDFTLTQEQSLFADSVQRYVQHEYTFEHRAGAVGDLGVQRAHWRRFAELGWLGAGLPDAVGGLDGGPADTAVILQELGRGLVVEPYLAVAVLAAQALNAGASAAQQQALLPALIDGDTIIALAHGEAGAQGELAQVDTRAAPDGRGGYRLTGRKTTVLAGPLADRLLVSARTSGGAGDEHGITLFLVARGAPGVTCHDYRLIDGSAACDVELDNVAAAADAVIGGVGGVDLAHGAIEHAYSHALVAACAEAVGAMDKAIWITRDYLQTRTQFGVTIGSFQALQHRMADMVCELEQSRAMLYRALAHLAHPGQEDPAARRHALSAAKVQIGRSAKFVGGQAIQLHGGIGMTNEYCIGHYFKRLTVIEALFGHTQYHLGRMARRYATAAA